MRGWAASAMRGVSRAEFARMGMLAFACLVSLALVFASLAPPRLQASLSAGSIGADSGFAYVAPVPLQPPPGFVVAGDSGVIPTSLLQLREDGKPLGPAHSLHVDIRSQGGGRYSHWGTQLWFSASDSSDPRSNGRSYSITAKASIHPLLLASVILLDVLTLVVCWRRLLARARSRRKLAGLALSVLLGIAALVAAGAFDPVNEIAGPPKDAALVLATLLHALLGCAVLAVQWTAGAGLARILPGMKQADAATLALLGFALGLPVGAAFAATALLVPGGFALGTAGLALCCAPLLVWRPAASELAALFRIGLGVLPFAIGFGCWIGLLWHGPTDTIAGTPSGDLVYYSTSIVSLAANPYPYLNLGFESEPLAFYFNLLYPALGAAISRIAAIDPFLFVTAGGGTTFVLGLGVALYCYIAGTGLLRGRHSALVSLTLALAVIAANRYPYWIVESIPMIHAMPLVIVVAYFARRKDVRSRLLAFAIAVAGSALAKVVGAAVLAPYVAAMSLRELLSSSRDVRIVASIAATAATAYAAYLLYALGAANFAAAPFGPISWQMMHLYGVSFMTAWPFILRDLSALSMALLVFLLADWLVAAVIAGGFLLFLIYPFVLLFDFVCATLILALLACDDPDRLWQHRRPLLGALLLALPAVILTDPGGISTGMVWLACCGGTIRIVMPRGNPLAWPHCGRAIAAATALLCLGLIAVARGGVVLSSGWEAGVLTPQVRQIWLTVARSTPPDALIFTDQTGTDATLLGGWNTYAFIGARQIFVSNLYMNSATRTNRDRSLAALLANDAVLRGEKKPGEIRFRGSYSSYFAVVSRNRPMPRQWVKLFENERYVLYRLDTNGV